MHTLHLQQPQITIGMHKHKLVRETDKGLISTNGDGRTEHDHEMGCDSIIHTTINHTHTHTRVVEQEQEHETGDGGRDGMGLPDGTGRGTRDGMGDGTGRKRE